MLYHMYIGSISMVIILTSQDLLSDVIVNDLNRQKTYHLNIDYIGNQSLLIINIYIF